MFQKNNYWNTIRMEVKTEDQLVELTSLQPLVMFELFKAMSFQRQMTRRREETNQEEEEAAAEVEAIWTRITAWLARHQAANRAGCNTDK